MKEALCFTADDLRSGANAQAPNISDLGDVIHSDDDNDGRATIDAISQAACVVYMRPNGSVIVWKERGQKTFACIESITPIAGVDVRVRVWREEPKICSAYDVSDLIAAVGRESWKIRRLELVERLVACGRVNAVEITDLAGHGIVVYPEWP